MKGWSMKRLGNHRKSCTAQAMVQAHQRKTVWMAPELTGEKLIYVCADPDCRARLLVLNMRSLRLTKW